jgi:hypothetical protein
LEAILVGVATVTVSGAEGEAWTPGLLAIISQVGFPLTQLWGQPDLRVVAVLVATGTVSGTVGEPVVAGQDVAEVTDVVLLFHGFGESGLEVSHAFLEGHHQPPLRVLTFIPRAAQRIGKPMAVAIRREAMRSFSMYVS